MDILNIFKPRTLHTGKYLEIGLCWTPLMIAYLPSDHSKTVRGNILIAILGVALDFTLYRESYKEFFYNKAVTIGLTRLGYTGEVISDWKVNLDMNRTVKLVSGYKTATGDVVITSIVYK